MLAHRSKSCRNSPGAPERPVPVGHARSRHDLVDPDVVEVQARRHLLPLPGRGGPVRAGQEPPEGVAGRGGEVRLAELGGCVLGGSYGTCGGGREGGREQARGLHNPSDFFMTSRRVILPSNLSSSSYSVRTRVLLE